MRTIKARKTATQEFIPWDENYGEYGNGIGNDNVIKCNGYTKRD